MTAEMNGVNFNELCRICLTKTDNMRQLLNYSGGEVSELISKLSSLINSEINLANNAHPNYMCCYCEEKLNEAYNFQQRILKSHQIILDYAITKLDIEHKYKPSASEEEVKEEIDLAQEDIYEIFEPRDVTSSDDENILDRLQRYNKKKSAKRKSTKKVVLCNQEEVLNYIKDVKMKFYTSRKCLFCGFSASNVRTLSVHMSRLHCSYKDNWCWKCNKIEDNLTEHTENAHKDELTCPFCSKKSTTGSHFVEHLSRHTGKRKHICQICEKEFVSTKDLKSHQRKKHNGHTLDCEICSEKCSDKMSLSEHLKQHKKIKCEICEESFNADKYDIHICFKREDSNQENNGNLLKNENIDIKDEEVLDTQKDNIKKISGGKPHRYCILCERRVRNLVHHVKKHHSDDSKKDEPKALCTYCGKQFKHQSNLDVHLRTHTKETPYKCSYCEVSVATRTRLVDHERTHTGEKPFVCRFCGKAFKQHGVLNTHLKIHTGRTEQCLLCPKKFCRPSELRNHMRVHTGEKPYPCTYCEKSFIQRSHLVEHTKIHTDHRPFKCHICGKAFKQSSTLKGHLNVHEGKKMYKCTVCSYSCRKNYTLKQHLLQHQNADQPANYPCDICEENFTSPEILSVHRSTQHDNLAAISGNITVDLKF